MEHIICRCKNCGRSYTYCTYGNGEKYGTEEGCSRDYCSDCQKALDSIPKKIEPRFMEIKEPLLFKLFDSIKSGRLNTDLKWPTVIKGGYHKYRHCETYRHKGIVYQVQWNDENHKHIFIQMEYDLINHKFTDDVYMSDKFDDSYSYCQQDTKDFSELFTDIIWNSKPQPMAEPIGKLHYVDFDMNWEVVTPSFKYEPPHELITYQQTFSGKTLKHKDKNSIFHVKVDVSNLVDQLQYICTIQMYKDETIRTIISIDGIE